MFQRLTTAHFSLGANIFLTSSGLIKLGDFGCSVKLKNNAQTMPGEVNSTLGTAGGSSEVRLCPGLPPACWDPSPPPPPRLLLVGGHGERSGLLARREEPRLKVLIRLGSHISPLNLRQGRKASFPSQKSLVFHTGFIKTILVKTALCLNGDYLF